MLIISFIDYYESNPPPLEHKGLEDHSPVVENVTPNHYPTIQSQAAILKLIITIASYLSPTNQSETTSNNALKTLESANSHMYEPFRPNLPWPHRLEQLQNSSISRATITEWLIEMKTTKTNLNAIPHYMLSINSLVTLWIFLIPVRSVCFM